MTEGLAVLGAGVLVPAGALPVLEPPLLVMVLVLVLVLALALALILVLVMGTST